MYRILLIAVVSLLILGVAFVYLMLRMQSEPEAGTELPTGIVEANNRSIIVELAITPASRTRGLSYRDALDEDRGMLFVFDAPRTQRFWMYEMRFPLDIIFLNGEMVVDIAANVPSPDGGLPAAVTSKVKADKILEINAGKAEEWGIRKGTIVRVVSGALSDGR